MEEIAMLKQVQVESTIPATEIGSRMGSAPKTKVTITRQMNLGDYYKRELGQKLMLFDKVEKQLHDKLTDDMLPKKKT